MAFNNKFTFVGTLKLPKEDAQRKFYEVSTNATGTWTGAKMNFFMQAGDNNGQFVSLYGGYKSNKNGDPASDGKIYSFTAGEEGKPGTPIEIAWKDRLDPSILAIVANFKKLRVNLGEEKEFITEYDFITYLSTVLPTIEDKKVYITGDFVKEEYNGKFYDKFIPKNIGFADEESAPKFKLVADITIGKDSVDTNDLEDDKMVRVAGYLQQYINSDIKNRYVMHNFVINAKNLDFDNDLHVKRLKYLVDKLTVDGYFHCPWEIAVFRGAEEVEFTEDMLTDSQKELIALGLNTMRDFAPRSTFGNNITEYRLVKPVFKGGFVDGLVDTGLDEEEFSALVYTGAVTEESASSVAEESGIQLIGLDDDDDGLDNLFRQ